MMHQTRKTGMTLLFLHTLGMIMVYVFQMTAVETLGRQALLTTYGILLLIITTLLNLLSIGLYNPLIIAIYTY